MCPVDDHGLEALRKSAQQVTPGDKSDYYLQAKLIDAIAGSFRPSGLTVGGKISVVTINDTTWTPLPASALADRNALGIQNTSAQEIKINYDNTVIGFVGVSIASNVERFYDITESIVIYAKCSSATCDITIEEIA